MLKYWGIVWKRIITVEIIAKMGSNCFELCKNGSNHSRACFKYFWNSQKNVQIALSVAKMIQIMKKKCEVGQKNFQNVTKFVEILLKLFGKEKKSLNFLHTKKYWWKLYNYQKNDTYNCFKLCTNSKFWQKIDSDGQKNLLTYFLKKKFSQFLQKFD